MARCPSGFNSKQGQGCYAACPLNKGFVDVEREGSFSCAFRNSSGIVDNSTLVVRQQTPFLPAPASSQEPVEPTLEEVQKLYPQQAERYSTELARFNQEISAVSDKVDRQQLVDVAFRKMQTAEGIKDKAPEAYIAAKNDYYTLTRGETWASEERRRVEANEVGPTLERAVTQYKDVTNRANMTTKLSELLSDTKKRVTGVQDEFRSAIELLGKQLRNVQDQLNLERHKTEQPTKILPIVGYVLNALLIIAILFAIWMVGKALLSQGRSIKRERFYDDRYY